MYVCMCVHGWVGVCVCVYVCVWVGGCIDRMYWQGVCVCVCVCVCVPVAEAMAVMLLPKVSVANVLGKFSHVVAWGGRGGRGG